MFPSKSSLGGNIKGVIKGSGFPIDIESKGDLKITLC